MTCVLADAVEQAQAIRTVAVWLLLVGGCLVAVFQLVNSLVLKPRRRRSIGAIRFQLALSFSAAARERPTWKPLLFAVGFSLPGGLFLLFALLNGKDLEWRYCYFPLLYSGMGCSLAVQFGRRDRLGFLLIVSGLCFSLMSVMMLAGIVSGETWSSEWTERAGIPDHILQYGGAIVMMGCGLMIIYGTVFGRTHLREAGIEMGSQILLWADVRHFEWFSYGDNYDLVITVPSGGSAVSQLFRLSDGSARKDSGNKAVKWLIPVPATKKEGINALLTDHVGT